MAITSDSLPVASARRKRAYGLPSLVTERMFALQADGIAALADPTRRSLALTPIAGRLAQRGEPSERVERWR